MNNRQNLAQQKNTVSFRHSIKRSLLFWFVLLTLLPMIVFALAGYCLLITETSVAEELMKVDGLKHSIWGLLILTGLLFSTLAFFLTRRLIKPLIELANVANAIAKGDLNDQIQINSDNEIGAIAKSLNHMLTEQNRRNQALEESNKIAQDVMTELTEQQYFLNQHAIVSVTDVKGNITLVNEKFCEISGYSRDELIGKNHRMLNSGHHDTAFFQNMYQTIESEEVWHGDICNKAKNGDLFWVDSTILSTTEQENRPKSYVAIRTDITVQKNAGLILKENTERLELVMENTGVGIWDWHMLTGEIECNERWAATTGHTLEELSPITMETWATMIHPEDLTRSSQLLEKHFDGETERYECEIRMRHKDGHWIWTLDTGRLVERDQNGFPKRLIGTHLDISSSKQIQQDLTEAKESAEIASKAKGDFLANMSHEIRTPMNGVLGMTELLLDNPLEPDQQHRALTIKRSAESLLTIINDILDFSKIEAGKLDLELLDFNLGTLIEDLADTFVSRTEEKQLELICAANPTIPQWYSGDPGRIRQILTNLVSNAIKFTAQGEISLRYKQIATESGNQQLHFEVKDTGIGLGEEQQKKLFQKFSQADSSTTRKFGGTGLGLAISKQLVELMGGEIGIISQPDQGSTFWFTIDLTAIEDKTLLAQPQGLQDQHILVVDDNTTNREVFNDFLTAWQVPHHLVASAPLALQALYDAAVKGNPYSIALIDMQMPGMDGASLGDAIRNDNKIANTRLALLTSQGLRGDAKKMHEHGFAAYLSKPIHQSELYNALLQLAGINAENISDTLITRYTAREQQPSFQANILVVDDNSTNQAVACGMLAKFGLDADIANNGQEALDMLTNTSYDLVFMDCQMPVMDGYTATRNIRDPKTKVLNHKIPIIAMTANAMQGDKEKCLAVGMDDFIPKPVDPIKLRKTLEIWLKKHLVHPIPAKKEKIISSENTDPKKETNDAIIFDYAAMSERLMDDKELILTVIEAYLGDMPKQFKQLEMDIQNRDIDQVTAQAHKIKGASANVGGMALSTQALILEQTSKAGDMNTIKQNFAKLEQQFTELKSEMEKTLL